MHSNKLIDFALLFQAINQSNSAEVSLHQLRSIDASMNAYLRRYRSRLSGKNLYYLNLFYSVIIFLKQFMDKYTSADASRDTNVSNPDVSLEYRHVFMYI